MTEPTTLTREERVAILLPTVERMLVELYELLGQVTARAQYLADVLALLEEA